MLLLLVGSIFSFVFPVVSWDKYTKKYFDYCHLAGNRKREWKHSHIFRNFYIPPIEILYFFVVLFFLSRHLLTNSLIYKEYTSSTTMVLPNLSFAQRNLLTDYETVVNILFY